MELWVIFIFVAILFFVLGQVCLKYDKNDGVVSCCYFTMAMGIVGIFTLLFLTQFNKVKLNFKDKSIFFYSVLAGILFFFGNLFWIYSIKTAPSLALIRVIMAGGETALLLLVGYMLFKQIITFKHFIGILLILAGVQTISF